MLDPVDEDRAIDHSVEEDPYTEDRTEEEACTAASDHGVREVLERSIEGFPLEDVDTETLPVPSGTVTVPTFAGPESGRGRSRIEQEVERYRRIAEGGGDG